MTKITHNGVITFHSVVHIRIYIYVCIRNYLVIWLTYTGIYVLLFIYYCYKRPIIAQNMHFRYLQSNPMWFDGRRLILSARGPHQQSAVSGSNAQGQGQTLDAEAKTRMRPRPVGQGHAGLQGLTSLIISYGTVGTNCANALLYCRVPCTFLCNIWVSVISCS